MRTKYARFVTWTPTHSCTVAMGSTGSTILTILVGLLYE